jgi:hypothetical protein
MHRRDLMKLLALGSAWPAVPAELLAACREIFGGLDSSAKLKALNPHQNATVVAMAECILPETDTPGAKSARVNEFIDHILADWYEEKERDAFLAALADVDSRTQKLFGKDFVDASLDQQSGILRALGDEMAADVDALETKPPGYRGSRPEPQDNFYFRFRQLTLTGYFTSEAGYTQQLHEEIIPGHWDGCVSIEGVAQKGPN